MTKPLPPIVHRQRSLQSMDSDDRSIVFVEKPSLGLPGPSSPPKSRHVKKRSMSVGEMELRKNSTQSSPPAPPPPRKSEDPIPSNPDTSLNVILNDFKGELSQLDPIHGSPLNLRDPSTPARRIHQKTAKLTRAQSKDSEDRPRASTSTSGSSTMPKLTLQLASEAEGSEGESGHSPDTARTSPVESPIVPLRRSSLQTPTRSGSVASNMKDGRVRPASAQISPSKQRGNNPFGGLVSRQIHGRSSSRDLQRLRSHHRSSASSSEPSLIPNGDERRTGKKFCTLSMRFNVDLSIFSPSDSYPGFITRPDYW
jgi:PH and SEC7 domain-containing protein